MSGNILWGTAVQSEKKCSVVCPSVCWIIQKCQNNGVKNWPTYSTGQQQLTCPVAVTCHHAAFLDAAKPEHNHSQIPHFTANTNNTENTAKHPQAQAHANTYAKTQAGWSPVSPPILPPLEYCHLFSVSMETKRTNEVGCVSPSVNVHVRVYIVGRGKCH